MKRSISFATTDFAGMRTRKVRVEDAKTREIESLNWLSTKETLRLLTRKQIDEPEQRIIRFAAFNHLRSMGDLFIGVASYQSSLLDCWFWDAILTEPITTNWTIGLFETQLESSDPNDQSVVRDLWAAHNVKFCREDLYELLGGPSNQNAKKDSRPAISEKKLESWLDRQRDLAGPTQKDLWIKAKRENKKFRITRSMFLYHLRKRTGNVSPGPRISEPD